MDPITVLVSEKEESDSFDVTSVTKIKLSKSVLSLGLEDQPRDHLQVLCQKFYTVTVNIRSSSRML